MVQKIQRQERGGEMELKFSGKQDVYLEVADRYKEYIKLGVIKNGEKLPSVRNAAADLGINPNTVAKAYSVLEKDGYIRSLPKKGVYVIYEGENENSNRQDYSEALDIIKKMKKSGMDKETLINMIEEVYKNDRD